jgi:hypothetical protein
MDLSGQQVSGELTAAVRAAGAPGGARTDRAVDVRVLEQLTAALSGWITPARLAAATQAALGHPVPPGLLSPQEEAMIGEGLFPASYQQQISPNLIRLDAFLVDLARCARAEMLTALAVGWLTVQVSASNATAPAVIIAGADEITRPHLERLADACERRRAAAADGVASGSRVRTPWRGCDVTQSSRRHCRCPICHVLADRMRRYFHDIWARTKIRMPLIIFGAPAPKQL